MLFRMQVRFYAHDNEPLARDLARYNQGQRRVARLMTLATYGLVYLQHVGKEPFGSSRNPAAPHSRIESGRQQNDTSYEYKMTTDDLAEVFGR